jgi:precorrin-6Y C5,15-methyltransferase (decarboxylating)
VEDCDRRLYVIGMGLDGVAGLSDRARSLLAQAPCIAGYPSYLRLVEGYPGDRISLSGAVQDWVALLRHQLQTRSLVLLASGDPLYFGIGRLLTEHLDRQQVVFIPHVSAVQLAFSRLGIPWQTATVVSVHGRSADHLITALRQGKTPIALLTDGDYTPAAIASLIQDLRLPAAYCMHVCSRLGAVDEAIAPCSLDDAMQREFPMPNVVVLERQAMSPDLATLPLLGIADGDFHTFADQPGLITKQEVRVLAIALLQVYPGQTIWDVGAGTGSVAVELGRLLPDAQIYAVEATAAGVTLIQANCDRFQVNNISVISGRAPAALIDLPRPHRIFIGGGGADLADILHTCRDRLHPGGRLLVSVATLEAIATAQGLLRDWQWATQLTQVTIARSTTLKTRPPAPDATRWLPLNPVTLIVGDKPRAVAPDRSLAEP